MDYTKQAEHMLSVLSVSILSYFQITTWRMSSRREILMNESGQLYQGPAPFYGTVYSVIVVMPVQNK